MCNEHSYDSTALGSIGLRRRRTINSPLLLMYESAMSSSAGSPYGVLSGCMLQQTKLARKEKVGKVMQGHLAPEIQLAHELKMLNYDILSIQNVFVV